MQGQHYFTVVRAIRELEKELLRVGTTEVLEVLLRDLLNGTIRHPDVAYNQKLVQKLRILEFRSGGDYVAPTTEQVEAHYRARLIGLRGHRQVYAADLKLSDDTDVVMEMAKDGDIVLAPDSVDVQGNKKLVPHPVQYGFAKVDGQETSVGVIVVTEAAYERSSAQYGRVSQFPTLPHGILLFIRVRVKVLGNEVLSAPRPDGKLLQNEIQRCRAALRAPREVEEGYDIALFDQFVF